MNRETLIKLRDKQKELKILNEDLKTKEREFKMDNLNLLNNIDNCYEKINVIKTIITKDALEGFKEDKIKKRLGGIGITQSTMINYKDEDAMVWVKENMPVAIKEILNKSLFNKFAKDNDLSFVEKEIVDKVTFPMKGIILEDE